jgi:hypothetical protein
MLHIVQTLSVFTGIFAAGMVSGTTGVAFPLIAGPIFLLIYAPPKAVANRDVLAHRSGFQRHSAAAVDRL